jgi:iron complex outermembrane recepter protein
MSQMLHKNNTLRSSIAAITLGLISCPPLMAQQQEETGGQLEEISVTGSRIRQTDGMATPTPVTVVTPEELNSFDPGGTVAEQLDALPQFFSTVTAQRSSGSLAFTVGSFLNMRGLGSQRTLVLLDGARMTPGDKRGPVNVDTFPTALVRTVDVVTGGASAAYGADALGGVTNFVIDREFQGLKINAGTGISEFGDGFRANASIAGGFKIGDRLNVIASVEARQIDQIIRDTSELDPSWYRRWGFVTNPAWSPGAAPGTPQRLTVPNVAQTDRHPYGMIMGTGTVLDGMVFNREGNGVNPFRAGNLTSMSGPGTTRTTSGGPEADLAYRAYLGPGQGSEAIGRSIFTAAQYQFTDKFSAYVQAIIGRSESNGINDRGSITGITMTSIWAPLIAVDNAYLPDYVRDTLQAAGRREFALSREGAFKGVPEIGIDSVDRNTFTTQTYTLGFSYDLPGTWNLTGNFSSGQTERLTHTYNMNRIDRIALAMDAVRHPETGNIVCRVNLPQYSPTEEQLRASMIGTTLTNSRTASDPVPQPLEAPIGLDDTVSGCVPFNIMGYGNISQDAIDYVGTMKKSVGVVEQDFAEILATGDIYEGWGYGPISMAAGFTWRNSSFIDEAYPEGVDALGPPLNVPALGIRGIARGYTGGSPNLHKFSTVPRIGGSFNVWEYFAEVQVPVWESTSGEQRLGGSAAFRQSRYNLSGSVDAWKIGLEFQVMNGLRLRATQSRDVREATFSERFDAQGGGGNVNDPENNGETNAITVVASGNPNLAPEKADTSVVGLVFEPQWSWAQGLSISADWYEVDIADAISQITQQDVVDRCFAGVAAQCENIERDPLTGGITRVFRRFFNQDKAVVEGIDFEVGYRMQPNFFADQFETFNIRLLGGKLLTRRDIAANGNISNLLDQFSPFPNLTGNITSTYGVGPWSFQLQGRFISGDKLNRTWVEGIHVDRNWVSSSTWWNGTIRYSSELSSGGSWNVGFNVLNLFDKNPPTIPSTTGNQGAGNQYDIFGRRYNLNISMQF